MTDNRVTTRDLYNEISKLNDKIDEIKADGEKRTKHLENYIDNHYVRNEAFEPVQKLAYGLAGSVLLAVLGAVVGLVVRAS